MRVKICGIQSARDADVCQRAGASALGFLCGVPSSVRCFIEPGAARDIIHTVPPYVATVLVTTLSEGVKIERLLQQVPASAIQLHGPIVPDTVAALRARYPYLKVIRAIPVAGRQAIDQACLWAGTIDALLLDSKGEDDRGGTGRTHDWSISREIVSRVAIPVILAGGLSPENVAAAVRAAGPFGVDVNSGVTDASLKKDPQRVAEFIRRAWQAAATPG